MYSEKIREYYRTFYGKTYHNMSFVTENIEYSGLTGRWKPSSDYDLHYVYKLEWGSGSKAKNYYGCTGTKPHKRLKIHCSVRGLDESRTKMKLLYAHVSREAAEQEEQWYIDQNYNKPGNHNKT